jgi:hypothetical protein
MAQFDTIIKGGTVVDGTRVPRYKADIGVKNGKIAKIGKLNSSDATKVVDASGLVVAPGFIDLHTHYDAQLHWDPYCSIRGRRHVGHDRQLRVRVCAANPKTRIGPCGRCRAPTIPLEPMRCR